MTAIRFRSRHLHATFFHQLTDELLARGWMNAPVNFGTGAVTVVDYQPDERSETIKRNTVAVSLGDYGSDDDEELGASGGGLRSALYSVYIDAYMSEQALTFAICDDVRDIYTDLSMPLIDQVTGNPVPAAVIEVEVILGPEKHAGNVGSDTFRKHWRAMRIDGRLFYQS